MREAFWQAIVDFFDIRFSGHAEAVLREGDAMPSAHWFPGADAALGLDWELLAGANRAESRLDEIEDVASLLRDHADPAAGDREASDAIAWAMACAWAW